MGRFRKVPASDVHSTKSVPFPLNKMSCFKISMKLRHLKITRISSYAIDYFMTIFLPHVLVFLSALLPTQASLYGSIRNM